MDELKTKMQEYLAIREQYYSAWKAAEDESDAARIRSAELATAGFEAKKARFRAGEDQPAPAEIEWKNALSAEKEAQDAERHARLAFYIAHDNAKRATMEYLREAAAEILSRYAGKAYGEKTREKIAAEAAEKTGFRMYINATRASSEIKFYPVQYQPGPREEYIIGYYTAAQGDPAPALIDNKIQKTSPETWKLYYCDEYHAGTPAEAAAAVEAAHAEALKAYAAFEAAAEKYNALRPANARSINAVNNRPDRIF